MNLEAGLGPGPAGGGSGNGGIMDSARRLLGVEARPKTCLEQLEEVRIRTKGAPFSPPTHPPTYPLPTLGNVLVGPGVDLATADWRVLVLLPPRAHFGDGLLLPLHEAPRGRPGAFRHPVYHGQPGAYWVGGWVGRGPFSSCSSLS